MIPNNFILSDISLAIITVFFVGTLSIAIISLVIDQLLTIAIKAKKELLTEDKT